MTDKKDPAPTQAPAWDHGDVPVTDGAGQGGTSQPGPPTDPEDAGEEIDFSKPDTGEGGTDRA